MRSINIVIIKIGPRSDELEREKVLLQVLGLPFVPGLPTVPFLFSHCGRSCKGPLPITQYITESKYPILVFPSTFLASNSSKNTKFLIIQQN